MGGIPGSSIEVSKIYNKVTDDYCWVHTRGGIIPGNPAIAVATTQQWAMGQSDIFSNIYHFRSDDMGKTWKGPKFNGTLGRRDLGNGLEMAICDQYPAYHKASGKLLSTGHTVTYDGGMHPASALDKTLRIHPAYTIYDPGGDRWSDWKIIDAPDDGKFYRWSSGCSQRYDLDDGTFLLPVAFSPEGFPYTRITVARCSFDGKGIDVLETGNELAVDSCRGLAEASVTKYGGRFYMTIRHDEKGYVSVSDDGLHYSTPESWKWDSGFEVGTYNTQSHWITHGDGLFLAYTRNAGNNSHVFRHRAPLFMAGVDVENLCLLRHTEKIVIPERGARLGNFSTVNVNNDETWVFNTEVLSPPDCVKYGCDGSIYLARIRWDSPNSLV